MVTTVEVAGRCAPAWRGGFGRLWSAAVLSGFGDALRVAALPLLAATRTDRPLLIASVTACAYLPWIVFGLVGGAVAGRVDQRRAMWAVDAVLGLLVLCFAAAVALGHASIALLIGPAITLTTLQTLFDNASTALLPALVDIVADAAIFLVASALVASLRTTAPERKPRPAGRTLRQEIAEGLRVLGRDRALRALCAARPCTESMTTSAPICSVPASSTARRCSPPPSSSWRSLR